MTRLMTGPVVPTFVRRWAAALAVAAALSAGALVLPATAQAAGCSGGAGVSVVVDYGSLGGVATGCASSPSTGFTALSQAGFSTTFVSGQPFLCRIDGLPSPADESCARNPPATAYWSYWRAVPGGGWTYSTVGAGSTHPPSGSTEGWAFGAGSPPGITPPPNIAAPPPPPPPAPPPPPPPGATTTSPPRSSSSAPGGGPSSHPASTSTTTTAGGASQQATSGGADTGDPSGAPVPPPSAAPASTSTRATDQAAAGTSATSTSQTVSIASATSADGSAGGPPWAVLAAVVVVLGLGGGAWWQARRRR